MRAVLTKKSELTRSINSTGTLKANVSSEGTLQANVSSEGTLRGTTSAQGSLKANVTSQGDLKASMVKQKSVTGKVGIFAISVDSELSFESTNPVQNKVVTAELDKKIEQVTFATNTDIDKLFSRKRGG